MRELEKSTADYLKKADMDKEIRSLRHRISALLDTVILINSEHRIEKFCQNLGESDYSGIKLGIGLPAGGEYLAITGKDRKAVIKITREGKIIPCEGTTKKTSLIYARKLLESFDEIETVFYKAAETKL